MGRNYNVIEIIKVYILGSIAYLIGGITSLSFEWIRENTFLYPRVPLIAAGLGGLLVGILLNGCRKQDLLRFLIISITSYLAVILINFILLTSTFGQEFSLAQIVFRIMLPVIVYSVVFGIQLHGWQSIPHFLISSFFSTLPILILVFVFYLNKNTPLGFESLWMYISLGASVAVSIKSYNIADVKD